MNSDTNIISFNENMLKSKFILLVLFFMINGCSSDRKKEEECYYDKPRSCDKYIDTEIRSRNMGSGIPSDGIVLIKDWIFYLTYFDNVSQKIEEKYVKVNCKCEIIYFDNNKPQELRTPFN